MNGINKIKAALTALQPIIVVNTTEPVRFRDLFLFPAVQAAKCFKKWEIRRVTRITPTTAKRWVEDGKASEHMWQNAVDLKTIADYPTDWYSQIVEMKESVITPEGERFYTPADIKAKIASNVTLAPCPELLWLENFEHIINPGDRQEIAIIDMLREAAVEFQSKAFKNILLVGTALKVPDILRPFTEVIELPLPDEKEIEKLTADLLAAYKDKKLKVEPKFVKRFVKNAAGLTEFEVTQAWSNAVALHNQIDENAALVAQARKQQKAKQSGVLEVRPVNRTLDSVGGLQNVKGYVDSIKSILLAPEAAKKYGLRVPSGMLLAGVPGSGKSLSCEAIAGTLGIGLCRFSLGALMDRWVGSSEQNIKQSFQMIEAIAPVVCQIDEIEKMIASDGAGHATFQICKGMLLTWMEERPPGIFIVATCNALDAFDTQQNNALIRARRLDRIYFVDLPGRKAREEIFKIHLEATGHAIPVEKLRSAEVIEASRGFNGAEIETVVQAALAISFQKGLEHPDENILRECARQFKPQSITMQKSIEDLRSWVKSGRADSAGDGVEDAPSGGTVVKTGKGLERFAESN